MSQTIEYTTPSMNPNVNYGLWLTMMCQCRFADSNDYAALVGDVNNGGGYACVEARGI